jgi:pyruvate dehydrogenase kinase 2/3/4
MTPAACTVGCLRTIGFSPTTKRRLSTKSVWQPVDVYDRIPSDVENLVQEYCATSQTSVSLQMLMKTGRGELGGKSYKTEAFMGRMGQRLATQRILFHFATFLRKEIPIRLAHRIQDLDQVSVIRDMKAVQAVKGIYIQSFLEMIEHPTIQSPSDEESFATMLGQLYTKHSNVLVQMAKGAYELREAVRSGAIQLTVDSSTSEDVSSLLDMSTKQSKTSLLESSFEHMYQSHKFLDRFYTSRIGIRVLAGQYLALRENPLPDYVGMICQKTSPAEIVRQAADNAMGICRKKYGHSPRVEITGRLDLTFPYIPTYLHYILLELLKNALRATVEHRSNHAETYPPVIVIIADGTENEDVVVKIADEGGGIPRSHMEKVWSYLYTTADSSLQEAMFLGGDHSSVSPIAGLGYGLPISRSYCRYFGGDIDVMSMEGHGTDVFVYLKRLGDSIEPMPV